MRFLKRVFLMIFSFTLFASTHYAQGVDEGCPKTFGWQPNDEELRKKLWGHINWAFEYIERPDASTEGKANLCNAVLQIDIFKEIDPQLFAWIDLSGAVLSGADLREAVLIGANLKGADLSNARFTWSYPQTGESEWNRY